MATYPLTPVKLSTIVQTDPTGAEDASKLNDAIVQTRTIFKSLLSIIMDDSGNLLVPPVIGANSVGTTALQALCVTAAKIANNTITAAQLAANAVTSTVLQSDGAVDANRAVTTNHIKDAQVTGAKIAATTIGSSNLAANAVTTSILQSDGAVDANRAVNSNHIKDNALITRHFATGQVTAVKLKSAVAGGVAMYWDDGATVTLPLVDSTGDVVPSIVASKVKFMLGAGKGDVFNNAALIVERGGSAADAGGCVAQTWNVRPNGGGSGATDFVELFDANSLVTFVTVAGPEKRIRFAQAGTYFVQMACAAYKSGNHIARLYDVANTVVLFETNANVNISTDTNQDYTTGMGIITIPSNNLDVRVEHWTRLTKATDGLGTHVLGTAPAVTPAANNTYMYLFLAKLTN